MLSTTVIPAVLCAPRFPIVRKLPACCCVSSLSRNETADKFFAEDSRPIMLFDGVCNLCNGGVRFARQSDTKRKLRYKSLQSEDGRELLQRSGRSPDDISSVVLVERNKAYIKSQAVLKIMEYLDLPFPQLSFFLHFVPLFIRDFAYDNIANNRYSIFGRSETCEVFYD